MLLSIAKNIKKILAWLSDLLSLKYKNSLENLQIQKIMLDTSFLTKESSLFLKLIKTICFNPVKINDK